MLTLKEARKLKRLIRKYAIAEVDKSWMGNKDPEAHREIVRNLTVSRRKLDEFVKSLTTEDSNENQSA